MNPFPIILMILGALLFAVIMFIAVQQGRENRDCRQSGGLPVKVAPSGYACIKKG